MLTPDINSALSDITLDEPWSLIERFTTLRREHPDDVRTACDEIVSRLRKHGVPVEVHDPEVFLSLPGKASVTVGNATFRAKPMAMSVAHTKGLTAPPAHAPARHAGGADELVPRNLLCG